MSGRQQRGGTISSDGVSRAFGHRIVALEPGACGQHIARRCVQYEHANGA